MDIERSWRLSFRQQILFEVGGARRIGQHVEQFNPRTILVVTDRGLTQAGIVDDVFEGLRAVRCEWRLFDGVQADPPAEVIMQVARDIEGSGVDLIVALGGGSSIDTGKAIAAMATNGGHILDYAGLNRIPIPPLPIVAIPTTAGTGSESTNVAIITDTNTHAKLPVSSDKLLPSLALLDPALLRACPSKIAAGSGMDALSHAIEAYLTAAANPITDSIACEAIRLIGRSLRTFVGNPGDLRAAADMLVASGLAGMAVSIDGLRLGAPHAMSESLTRVCSIHHGASCGLLLPAAMDYLLTTATEKLRRISELIGLDLGGLSAEDAARRAVDYVASLQRDLGLPTRLSQVGVKEEHLRPMAQTTMTKRYLEWNPRPLTEDAVVEIYRSAL
ncbi:MAG: iron-containing alcohol dehydrogenase [Chloroflexi bacterium]|nr:iron-containing alcohol dehydrogenase [Chloroflexota bacterium]